MHVHMYNDMLAVETDWNNYVIWDEADWNNWQKRKFIKLFCVLDIDVLSPDRQGLVWSRTLMAQIRL